MGKMAPLPDCEIRGLTADSRKVGPGYLFAALPGSRLDGRAFIDDAVARGAVAVLLPKGGARSQVADSVALVEDENPRRLLSLLAASFYELQPEKVVAVTGTNGKTSVASFTRQIWANQGLQAASLGTLGLYPPRADAPASLTTPDPVDLHACLADLAQSGTTHLALEASSHGLDQYRLDGLRLTAAAFTNLSRDHLDYHGDMAGYLAAKTRLFRDILPPGAHAVLNADASETETLREICTARAHKIIEFGRKGRDLTLIAQRPSHKGQVLQLEIQGRVEDIDLPLIGTFQADNVLAAFGLALASGLTRDQVLSSLPRLEGVSGRIEHVASTPTGGEVYVDYAHTPDALETVLKAVRPHCGGRLVVVFGCGGDRDRGKRPIMGEIAGRLADRAIVTDDNPRSEDAAAIRRQILDAVPEAEEIGDRGAAIAEAMATLGPDDVLVIAGKGHESGQIVGDRVLPFYDPDVARAAAARLNRAGRET
jgi:UDP-N-acetylmuramoyl-L-alanyl-D-glutamate--2,6-diaminopimelate ligase